MSEVHKPTDPVRVVANVTRYLSDGHYTMARASVGVQSEETPATIARNLREATVRDLRRSRLDEPDTFYEGIGSLTEKETIFALGEAQAGRGVQVLHFNNDEMVPGSRFKWMSKEGEQAVYLDIRIINRAEQERSNRFLASLAA